MRKLILQLAVSLDGFIEGPNGEFDWCFTDQDYGMIDFFNRIDAVFFGRKSYEVAMSIPDNAGWMPPVKQYIFSNTLKSVDQPAELVQGDIISKITSIKEQPGKDIWLFGGASLTKSLLEAKLIDELILAVHPILLGNGKPLFHNINDRIKLNLLNTKAYNTGLVMLSYELKQ